MPRLTAVLHTHNDALRLGRCLETLYPCDGILIVDHGSQDATLRIARQYAARVLQSQPDLNAQQCGRLPATDWVLCLDPRESLTEALAASLYEWKLESCGTDLGFSMRLREETPNGWVAHREAQTRMVPENWPHWNGAFPVNDPKAHVLQGEILRFGLP